MEPPQATCAVALCGIVLVATATAEALPSYGRGHARMPSEDDEEQMSTVRCRVLR